MATKRPSKKLVDPLQEAADPATDPERLRQLADHEEDYAVMQAAWRNPSVPEDVWRTALLIGVPETWANPMAPVYVLTWTPHEDDSRTLHQAAYLATAPLWKEPERCSPEGKALLNAKVQESWATSESVWNMMRYLGEWARAKGNGSVEHREVVRIFLLCVRTAPDLTVNDQKALDLLDAWTAGGQDRRRRADDLADSNAVANTIRFAQDPSYSPWDAIYEILEDVVFEKEGIEREEAKAEHSRQMADLIRREMPLPPVVD